jgi:hypothetical protein
VHSFVDYVPLPFAIRYRYQDADDFDHLRSDPAFKPACRRTLEPVAICVRNRRCRS